MSKFENVATCLAWTMCFMRYDWANDAIHVRMWQCVLLWLLRSVDSNANGAKGNHGPFPKWYKKFKEDLFQIYMHFKNIIEIESKIYINICHPPPKIYLFHMFAGLYKVLKHFCSFPPKPWFFKSWNRINNLFIIYYLLVPAYQPGTKN